MPRFDITVSNVFQHIFLRDKPALHHEAGFATLFSTCGAGRKGNTEVHGIAVLDIDESEDGIGVSVLARRLRTLSLFVERNDAQAIIADRTLAARGALGARIETDGYHIGASQDRLRGVNDG